MRKPVFIAMLGVYALLFFSKKLEWYFPELINSYLSDFLCLPLVLSIARYGVAYWRNDARFRLNAAHIVAATASFIILFELLLPKHSTMYTADPADVLLYSYGALTYYFYQTRTLTSSSLIQRHSDQR